MAEKKRDIDIQKVILRPRSDLHGTDWLSSLRQPEHDNEYDGMYHMDDTENIGKPAADTQDITDSPMKDVELS